MNLPDFGKHQPAVDEFHRLYYGPAHQSVYLDWPLWKSPTDMFIYQEIIWATKPDLIVECGTAFGASALFMAHFLEKAGIDGQIVSVDIAEGDSYQNIKLPRHERITYLRGVSSVDERVVEHVDEVAANAKRRMVILDSNHARDHVLAELETYAALVTPGCFLVVEDTNVNGHPVFPDHGPGPYEAVEQWLPEHPEFEQVHPYEKYLQSFHHAGWLRRRS